MRAKSVTAEVGRRVRALRQSQGLTLDDVAAKANVSKFLLSRLENGRVSSSIATLSNVAAALGTTLGQILGDPTDERVVVVRARERKRVARRGGDVSYTYESLAHKRVVKRMEPFLVTYAPGGPEPPLRAHPGEGFLFVLTGRIEFRHGAERVALARGDSAYFDNEVPHSARALGRRGATALLVVLSP